ncbi:hypothetical protein BDW74DRAFT_173012 [Aspergillus multicolor]|uniref:DEAD/DEAH box helicase n=1 Tax=Aspergillus multicolor TaxID=41759 RepID=UPI003CCE0B39
MAEGTGEVDKRVAFVDDEANVFAANLLRHDDVPTTDAFDCAFAVMGKNGCTGVLGILEGTKDTLGVKPRFQPIIQSGIASYLQLKFRVQFQPVGDPHPKQDDAFIYLGEKILERVEVKTLVAHDLTPTNDEVAAPKFLSEHHSKLGDLIEQRKAFQVRIYLKNRMYNARNMFTERVYGDGSVNLTQFKKYLIANKVLTLFVLGDGFIQTLNMGMDVILNDRAVYNQWYPKHPERHYLQLGDYPKPEERPVTVCQKPKTSTQDFSEYATIYGFGAIYEHEHHKRQVQALKKAPVTLRAMHIPNAGDRRYYAFIKIDAEKESNVVDLYPGDHLTINWDPNFSEGLEDEAPSSSSEVDKPVPEDGQEEVILGTDRDGDGKDDPKFWHATVVHPLPVTPFGYITLLITRRWSRKERKWAELSPHELKAIDSSAFPRPIDAAKAIVAAPGREVQLNFIDSAEPFAQSITALRHMADNEIHPRRRLLLGNAPMRLEARDMFEGIDVPVNYSETVGFNAEQAEAFKSLRKLAGGVGIFQGPPGTGKTHWLIHSIMPIHEHGIKHPEQRKQSLLIGPNNAVVDDLARKANEVVKEVFPGRDIIVVRCHSMSTEEDLVLQRAASHRAPEADARPPILDGNSIDISDGSLAQMVTSYILASAYANETATQEGVTDKRLALVELSLGWRMLQLCGIIPASFSEPEKYGLFVAAFNNYMSNVQMNEDRWKNLNQRLRLLRNDMLARADTIVCTAFAASSTPIRENVFPTVIGVDEAARPTESELWAVLAYFNPPGLLLVGDHCQLRPLVFTHPENNPFSGYSRLSLFARLILGGHPSTMFCEQRRMIPGLCSVVSQIFYNWLLRTGPLEQIVIDIAASVQKVMRQTTKFKLYPLTFVDAGDTASMKDSQDKSTLNMGNASVVSAIAGWLIENGISAETITILTPYRAQQQLLYSMVRQVESLQRVQVETIDSFQGRESFIVILDLTATEDLRFVADPNRLCVALSRARSHMFIVNNWEKTHGFEPRKDKDKRLLKCLRSTCAFVKGKEVHSAIPDCLTPRIKRAVELYNLLPDMPMFPNNHEESDQEEQETLPLNNSTNTQGNWNPAGTQAVEPAPPSTLPLSGAQDQLNSPDTQAVDPAASNNLPASSVQDRSNSSNTTATQDHGAAENNGVWDFSNQYAEIEARAAASAEENAQTDSASHPESAIAEHVAASGEQDAQTDSAGHPESTIAEHVAASGEQDAQTDSAGHPESTTAEHVAASAEAEPVDTQSGGHAINDQAYESGANEEIYHNEEENSDRRFTSPDIEDGYVPTFRFAVDFDLSAEKKDLLKHTIEAMMRHMARMDVRVEEELLNDVADNHSQTTSFLDNVYATHHDHEDTDALLRSLEPGILSDIQQTFNQAFYPVPVHLTAGLDDTNTSGNEVPANMLGPQPTTGNDFVDDEVDDDFQCPPRDFW